MQDRSYQIVAASLLAAFTALQVIILFVFGYTPYPDSEGYLYLAADCIREGEPYPVSSQVCTLPFLWNIGAIDAVALSLWLTGSVKPLLIGYCLLKGATAWLVWRLAYQLFNKHQVALTVLLLYVLYPANYGEATATLSELPFMFFAMAALVCSLSRHNLSAGLLLAIANWFRPMALVLIVVLILYHLFTQRKSSIRPIARLSAGYIAAVGLIGASVWLRTGCFAYQAMTGWMNLYQYSVLFSPDADAQLRQFPDGDPKYIANAETLTFVEKDAVWRREALQWIAGHPAEYVRQMPDKLLKTYISDNVNMCTFLSHKEQRAYLYDEVSMPSLLRDWKHPSFAQALALINLLYYYLLLIGFAAGCAVLYRCRLYAPLLLCAAVCIVNTLLIVLAAHGETRYHLMQMPFIIIVCATLIRRPDAVKP
ncbi:MAG: hypothetical protein IJ710_03465 [Prevotella sp.]|nr:hypothetical protein [Prevotella sp.]